MFDKITDTNDMTNATTAIAATPLINVNDFSNAVRRLHQLGFLKIKKKWLEKRYFLKVLVSIRELGIDYIKGIPIFFRKAPKILFGIFSLIISVRPKKLGIINKCRSKYRKNICSFESKKTVLPKNSSIFYNIKKISLKPKKYTVRTEKMSGKTEILVWYRLLLTFPYHKKYRYFSVFGSKKLPLIKI